MTYRCILAALTLLALLAAPLAASETIKLRGGRTVKGTATAYDAERQVLHFRLESGPEKQYPLAELDARTVYLVYTSVIPKDDAKAQLTLANFARDAGLYRHAARHYGYAEADPALAGEVERERAKLRSLAAAFCLENAKAAQAKGDAAETEKWLKLLLEKLPDEPQAAEAAALLERTYAAHREAKQAELHADFREKVERDAKRGKAAYEKMVEDTRRGLTSKSGSAAKRLWEGALREGQTVLKEIEALEEKYGEDPTVREGAEKYRRMTIEQMVDVNLHLASRATTQSSLNEALEYANAALALDPKSRDALAARARIEQAANEGLIRWR